MVEYSLTEFGKTLIPVLKEIAKWSEEAVQNSYKVEVISHHTGKEFPKGLS